MPLGRRQPDSRYYRRRSVHSLCRRRARPSRGAGQNLPTRPSNSAAPDEAHSPNILNLRRLLGGRALAHRLQAEAMSTALARDRAVPSIASDVNSTSFVQSPSQRSSAVPASQQTDSEPFSALLDAAAAARQQTGAPANPPPTPQQPAISSPPQGSSFQSSSFQSNSFEPNSSPKSTAATKDRSNPQAETSPGEKSQPAPSANATAPTSPSPSNNTAPAQDSETTNPQSAGNPAAPLPPVPVDRNGLAQAPDPSPVQTLAASAAAVAAPAKRSPGDKKGGDDTTADDATTTAPTSADAGNPPVQLPPAAPIVINMEPSAAAAPQATTDASTSIGDAIGGRSKLPTAASAGPAARATGTADMLETSAQQASDASPAPQAPRGRQGDGRRQRQH
jgi:hypothetical protein